MFCQDTRESHTGIVHWLSEKMYEKLILLYYFSLVKLFRILTVFIAHSTSTLTPK